MCQSSNIVMALALGMTGALIWPLHLDAQSISYTGGIYSENFDFMGPGGTNTPPGWFCGPGANGNGAVAGTGPLLAGDGSQSITGHWNLGTAGQPERALGSHAGNAAGGDLNMEVRLVNQTGRPIQAFEIHYDGEQWRANRATQHPQRLEVRFSTNGIDFVSMGTNFWFTELQPDGTNALNGNLATNRVSNIGGVYTPSSPVAAGATIYLRWWDDNNKDWDQLLAIDNFSFRKVIQASNAPTVVSALRLRDLTNLLVTFSEAMSTNVSLTHGSVLAPSRYTLFQTMDRTKTLQVYGFPNAIGSFYTNSQTTVRFTTESPIAKGYDREASYTLMVSQLADLDGNNITEPSSIVLTAQYGFQHGVHGYNFCQDTSLTPGTNLGWVVLGNNNDSVWADTTDGLPPDETQGLLKFENLIGSEPGQIPSNAIITSARLTLYSTRSAENSGSRVLVFLMLTNWSQATATFFLFGTNGVQTNGIQAATTPMANFLPNFPNPYWTNTQSRTVEVTSSVQAWANGQSNYGWLFLGTSGDGYGFDSIKFPVLTNHPLLAVEFDSSLDLTAMPPTNHVYVSQGTPFNLTFGFSKGSAQFQWYQDDQPIAGARSSAFWVVSATPADTGIYYLQASNHVKATNSPPIAVTVLSSPLITQQPVHRTLFVNTTASFSLQAAGAPPLSFQWRLNGANLGDGINISGANRDQLIISNVQPDDAGLYSALVTNAYGQALSIEARLTVLVLTNGFAPALTLICSNQNQQILSWTIPDLLLQQAENLEGPWQNITPPVTSPFTLPTSPTNKFYRLWPGSPVTP